MIFAFVPPFPLPTLWRSLAWAALLLGLTGCGQQSPAASGAGGTAAKAGRGGGGAAPVLVAQATRKVVPLVIDAIGAVEPIRSAAIRAQLTGTLFKIDFKEGEDVQAGAPLFELDPRPFENALRSAEADLKRFGAQLDYARVQVARYKTLSADSMVSKEQFQKIQDDERTLTAQLEASKVAVENAKLQLDYCTIKAPITGRTGNLSAHEGDLIRANDLGPMVTINQLRPIYVTFGVPQQHLADLSRYRAAGLLTVAVVPPGADDKPEMGDLTFVDNMVDSTTGTLKLKGTFPNDSGRLWPGQFATVSVTLAAPRVLTIPTSAVETSQVGQHVFVVRPDKTAEHRTIVVERILGNDAVVSQGLSEGETVVIDGQLRVTAGKPVEIKPAETLSGGEGAAPPETGKGKRKDGKNAKEAPPKEGADKQT